MTHIVRKVGAGDQRGGAVAPPDAPEPCEHMRALAAAARAAGVRAHAEDSWSGVVLTCDSCERTVLVRVIP